jgi:hypothetical protein
LAAFAGLLTVLILLSTLALPTLLTLALLS